MKSFQYYKQLHDEGLISMVKHRELPIYVLSFKHLVRGHARFNEISHIRGLVIDASGNILARPFPKFYNYFEEEVTSEELDDEFNLYEKLDGSLIILFNYNGEWLTTTRGTFHSEQAVIAKDIIDKGAMVDTSKLSTCFTYLFEYTSHANRVVVEYNEERLTLLAMYNTYTGVEIPLPISAIIPGISYMVRPVAVNVKGEEALMEFQRKNLPNKEGYVAVSLTTGKRYKFKFADYWELHKVLTRDITCKTLLEDVLKHGSWDDSLLYSKAKETEFTKQCRAFTDDYISNMAGLLKQDLKRIRNCSHEIFNDSPAKQAILATLSSELDYIDTLKLYKNKISNEFNKRVQRK